jgi:hypothetical protein
MALDQFQSHMAGSHFRGADWTHVTFCILMLAEALLAALRLR